ncbi:hypothetical protein BH11BAC3_BH11BAC3_43960 [soil metagenome]
MVAVKLFTKLSCVILFTFFTIKLCAQKSTLIEFGWDYPDVDQLSKNLPAMQQTPFDGMCFAFNREIMEAFDTLRRLPGYYQPEKLKNLQWGKYQSNFFILWGFGKTGGHWFNDKIWNTITCNMADLSKALANPGIRGVLFDPEYYYQNQLYNPWTYTKAQYPNHTYNEMRLQVKKRGVQFIRALQKYKADLTFLSIWITSLIAIDRLSSTVENTRHALLMPFIEGILEGKKSTVKIIDGNEFAYWYGNPSQFLNAPASLQANLIDLMQSKKAKKEALKVEFAQPVFYDGIMGLTPEFNKGFSEATKWKWLEESTKFAFAATNEFVWFYSERINWWNGTVSDSLHQLLEVNKNAQATSSPLKRGEGQASRRILRTENVNTGKGYFYLTKPKIPMDAGTVAFNYSLDQNTNKLSFNFAGKIPIKLSVFINNELVVSTVPKSTDFSVVLKNIKKGKLVMLAKYADDSEATAIEICK